ncbi:putative sugar phosphate/phosphate translocator [Tetrabaena socialis]|uniref:Putative sugar phosphate/phosphate translocator n=1 Tax=Tetrabaena socialis TaxID=47790 RepID=A0A2J7ZTY6_9CHLO|nr:putative sugar phosphate/phosphate translocator [Tetrabaena socialis]|eukprot:PNH03735.1 putative sugar phosphate/phosphate translocator [Tetrabaena socialis]
MLAKDPATQAKVVREVIRSYSYVLLWMCVSCGVIMFNKWLLAYSGFPFPIALTLWHMFFCSFVGVLAVRVFKVVKSHNMTPRDYYTRVMPIGTGVVVYNHMKLQMIKSKVAVGAGKADEEKPKDGGERSKEDILSEIRRLQSQMAELEDRVSSSAKAMNGGGGGERVVLLGGPGAGERAVGAVERVGAAGELVVSAQVVAVEQTEKEMKDK